MRQLAQSVVLYLLALLVAGAAFSGQWGRYHDKGQRARFMFTIGEMDPFEASVVETDRPINELRPEEQRDNAESFALEDFGFDKSNDIYGLSFEYIWKYLTIFVDGTQMNAKATGTAPRDLFMSVDEVFFEGQRYDYQAVLDGTTFNADLDITFLNPRLAYTPWTFNPDGAVQFVPWVHLGIFGVYGRFDIDNGAALRIQEYENPPRDYVVGGRSKGDVSAYGPEIGIGGELKFKTTEKSRLSVQANYSIFEFSGTSSDIKASSRREKSLDYDYSAFDIRAWYEIPVGENTKFLVGAEYRRVDIDALSEALDRPTEDVLLLREKFNKDIDMSLNIMNLSVGVRF